MIENKSQNINSFQNDNDFLWSVTAELAGATAHYAGFMRAAHNAQDKVDHEDALAQSGDGAIDILNRQMARKQEHVEVTDEDIRKAVVRIAAT